MKTANALRSGLRHQHAFSAVGWSGALSQCVELASSSRVAGLTCREIIMELAGIVARKLRFSDELVADSLSDFLPALK